MHSSPYFRRTLRDRLIGRCLLAGTLAVATVLVLIPTIVAFFERCPA